VEIKFCPTFFGDTSLFGETSFSCEKVVEERKRLYLCGEKLKCSPLKKDDQQ